MVLFVGASEEFADAINLLREETPARVVLRPIEFICLLVDGAPIPANMPLALRPPRGGYKKPHFAAVCFDKASRKNVQWMTNAQKESF